MAAHDLVVPRPAGLGLKSRMRISLISYRLPVSGQKRGGVDRVAHDLADGLARRGHLVKVWSYDPKPTDAAYEVQMLPWKKFVDTKLGFRITGGYIGNIVNLLPQYDGDLLIANGDSLLMPLLRKPLIRIMHGSALGEAFSSTSPLRLALQLGIWPQELLAALLQPGCVGVSHNCRRYNPFIHNIIPLGGRSCGLHAGAGKQDQMSFNSFRRQP